jgi:hypothetical protein
MIPLMFPFPAHILHAGFLVFIDVEDFALHCAPLEFVARKRGVWLHCSIYRPDVVCTSYLYFWFRLHCAKTRTLRTHVSLLRSRYWLVRFVLLHPGTRATGKSINRPRPRKKDRLANYFGLLGKARAQHRHRG